jgi:hypothetical protein
MTDPRLQSLRDLIHEDELDRAGALLRPLAGEQGDRVINLCARLAGLRRDRADGTVSDADARVERTRIRLALLSVLDSVEREAQRLAEAASPGAGPPVDFVIFTPLEEEREAVLAKLQGYRKLDGDGADVHTYFEAEIRTRRRDGAAHGGDRFGR